MTSERPQPSRAELLKQLRTRHAASVARTQALLKEQKQMQQQLLAALKEKPQTIPELAGCTIAPAPREEGAVHQSFHQCQ